MVVYKLCRPHRAGVAHGAPPFFYAECARCQEKKAAGLVTGNEGPVPENVGWRKRGKRSPRTDQAKFAAQAKRDREGRRRAYLGGLDGVR